MAASSGTSGAAPPSPHQLEAMASSSTSMPVPDYLSMLSPAQLAAATHPAVGALSISAPPGSGKTRVLTSRVAWLVREQKLMPEELIVVTFTNKAMKEMRARLDKLIGTDRTSRLVLGTFHAVCTLFLRRNAGLIGLNNDFTITNADDSKKLIKDILKEMKEHLEAEGLKITPDQAASTISWSKAKDVSPKEYRANINKPSGKGYRAAHEEVSSYKSALATVYEEYEKRLHGANALDFDDLMVYGAKLLKEHPRIVAGIRHVLVDEMQDTNTTQYMLMSCFSSATRCVTTVGDPDQAVYGWRAAEVGNLDRMKEEYNCQQALLEENYRSTGKILEAALAVIKQDDKRVAKGLFTSHPSGPPASLRLNASPQQEASFVASEIKRLIAHSGDMLNYGDFAILLRYNALSREVEQALQAENIPSQMLGGHKFFDRVEVRDILAYLTLAVNPTYTPAFTRVVNVPKRGVGDKSVEDFLKIAENKKMSPMALAEAVVDEEAAPKGKKGAKAKGNFADVKPTMKRGLSQLVGAVRELKSAAAKGAPVGKLITLIMDNIDYKGHLQKSPQDLDARLENIKELINFSTVVEQMPDFGGDITAVGRAFEETLEVRRELRGEPEDDAEMQRELRGEPVSDSEEGAAIEAMDEVEPRDERPSVGSARNAKRAPAVKKDQGSTAVKREPQRPALKRKASSTSSASSRPTRSTRSKSAITIEDSDDAVFEEEEEDLDDEDGVDEDDNDDFAPSNGNKTKVERKIKKAKTQPTTSNDDRDGSEEPSLTTPLPQGVPLRTFLEACTLSTDAVASEDSDSSSKKDGKPSGPKVTISTCHASKGLEYPVVFVLGVEDGIFPFYKSVKQAEVDEERRLLYVAMTRAQALLYLSHCSERMLAGQMDDKQLSQFITPIASKERGGTATARATSNASSSSSKGATLIDFADGRPTIDADALQVIGTVLQRPVPDTKLIDEKVKAFEGSVTAQRMQQLDLSSRSGGAGRSFGSYGGYGRGYGRGYGNFGGDSDDEYGQDDNFGSMCGAMAAIFSGRGRGRGGFRGASSSRSISTSTRGGASGSSSLVKHEIDTKPQAKPPAPHAGFSSALSALDVKDKSRFNALAQPGGNALHSTGASSRIASSPRWIEDYKRGGAGYTDGAALAAAEGAGAGQGKSRDDLMKSFQTSSQNSIDALKGLLPGGGEGGFEAGHMGGSSGSGSRSGSGSGIGNGAGLLRKPGKSLGMSRRTPSNPSSSGSSSGRGKK